MSQSSTSQSRTTHIVLTLVLLAITALVYAPVHHHDFVNYDDPLYVEDNPHVQQGLTWDGIAWAFTTGHASNWHPLTWLSHMLDIELYGLDPGDHHVTNLMLHLAATLALLLALARLSGRFDLSLLVAALFALHPAHVESVAWISERKDVLSGLFFGLTLWAYAAYVERPSTRRYLTLTTAFALGLLSKPMLVTLPFVLLLLDIWPLHRVPLPQRKGDAVSAWQRLRALFTARPLWWEKAPLFLMVAISSAVTYRVQQAGGAVSDLEQLPFLARLANSAVALAAYVGKLLWPIDLGVLYPHPGLPSVAALLASLVVLGGLTFAAWRLGGRDPFVLVGLLWFAGMLVPVLGLVQVGVQAMADRYTYLPYTGLFLLLVWGADAFLAARPAQSKALGQRLATAAVGLVLISLIVLTWHQVRRWQTSLTLFEHTLDVTGPNHHMQNIVGITLLKDGRVSDALPYFQEAVRIRPNFARAHNNLGIVAQRQGRLQDALGHFRDAARFNPRDAEAQVNQANVLGDLGRVDEALRAYQRALDLSPGTAPGNAEIQHNLALTLVGAGRGSEALPYFERAATLAAAAAFPDAVTIGSYWGDLANGQAQAGRLGEAEESYRRALAWLNHVERQQAAQQRAQVATVQRNLGSLLASQGRLNEAVEAFRAAVQADATDARARALLVLALASSGQAQDASRELRELERRAPEVARQVRQQLSGAAAP